MKHIKASEIGPYLEQSPEQYQAVLNATAKWCILEGVRKDLKPLVAEAQAIMVLKTWEAILPTDDFAGDFLAILEVHYASLEADFMQKLLPLPIAAWYEKTRKGSYKAEV